MLQPYIVERGVIRLIGRRNQFGGNLPQEENIGPLFDSLEDFLAGIPNRVDQRFYGISIDYWQGHRAEDGREGLRSYMVAAEVRTLTDLPFALESRVVPATRWLYIPVRYDDPEVQALAPEALRDDVGYLTGCVFGWSRRWIAEQGLERQDFPDELEIYGLHDGYAGVEGGANLTLAVPIV